jgi:hypothetical protein
VVQTSKPLFQFLLVRLKVFSYDNLLLIDYISIPSGTIKSHFILSSKNAAGLEFQFLLVRLKVNIYYKAVHFSVNKFQFLLVRLKGVFQSRLIIVGTIKKLVDCLILSISIPSGTIKSQTAHSLGPCIKIVFQFLLVRLKDG